MANYQNGGRSSASEEHRPSWRPQDQSTAGRERSNEDDRDYGSWRDRNEPVERDPRRWEGSRGSELNSYERDRSSTEYYGQGQSGYSAGRYGDDRSHQGNIQNRNEMWSPGGVEDRQHDLGADDRWSGRGGSHWSDRRDRGHENDFGGQSGRFDRGGGQRNDERYDQRYTGRGYDPRQGGQSGSSGGYDRQGYGSPSGDRMARMNDMGPYGYDQQRMGYSGGGYQGGGYQGGGYQGGGYQGGGYQGGNQGGNQGGYDQRVGYTGAGQHGTDWSPSQRGVHESQSPGQHVHRGNGPHRGKGPQGYQRSDERIRELVCEALSDDDQIDASQIQVSVKDGEVTLTGTVDNRRIRREAEDCVASVSGVRDVQVQLRIKDEQREQRAQGAAQSHGTSGSLGNGTANKIETEVSTGASGSSQDKKHRA